MISRITTLQDSDVQFSTITTQDIKKKKKQKCGPLKEKKKKFDRKDSWGWPDGKLIRQRFLKQLS